MSSSRTLVIKRNDRWTCFDWGELFSYREVLYALVKREFLSKYKRTLLGPLWYILQPIVNSLVFTLVFFKFAGISTSGVEPKLFYFCALLPWTYFANSAETISNSLIVNAYIFEKVYFPRLIVPVATLISHLITFTLQLCVFLLLCFYTRWSTPAGLPISTSSIWMFPLFLLLAATTSLGVGLWIASLTVHYRDLQYVRDFVFRIWMFLTPVIYPSTLIPMRWKWLIEMNPLTAVIEGFRHAFFGTAMMGPLVIGKAALLSAVLLITGLLVFNRVQRNFIDDI